MENERKRVDVKLVNKWSGRYGAEALIARPNFHSRTIFDEDLVAVQLARTEIVIRKPIYVGLAVLDISKTLIYDFHYSYMRQRVGDKSKLLYTDTDSLIYEIQGINMYRQIRHVGLSRKQPVWTASKKQEGDRTNERRVQRSRNERIYWIAE